MSAMGRKRTVALGQTADLPSGLSRWRPVRYHRSMATDVFQDRFGQDGLIKVIAAVTLLATEDGGRAGPIRGSYRQTTTSLDPITAR